MPRTFVYFLENVASPARDAIASHVAYLRALDDRGARIVCGPFCEGGGGMVVIEATSTEDARAIAAGDPFVVHGFKRFGLREFERATARKSRLARRPDSEHHRSRRCPPGGEDLTRLDTRRVRDRADSPQLRRGTPAAVLAVP